MARKKSPTLTDAELRLMDVIWQKRSASAAEVLAALPDAELAYTTVLNTLRILENKGYVRHKVDGRTYIYSVAEQAKNVAVRAVRQIIDRFWSGSAEQFLTGMVDEKILTPAEIARLARKITQAKRRRNTDA